MPFTSRVIRAPSVSPGNGTTAPASGPRPAPAATAETASAAMKPLDSKRPTTDRTRLNWAHASVTADWTFDFMGSPWFDCFGLLTTKLKLSVARSAVLIDKLSPAIAFVNHRFLLLSRGAYCIFAALSSVRHKKRRN